MKKSFAMQNIELRFGKPLEAVIREHIEAGLTQEEIAREFGISYWTFRNWLGRLGARMTASVRFTTDPDEETVSTR